MAVVFANSEDPNQTPYSGSALFANYPFKGLPTAMGEKYWKSGKETLTKLLL